MNKPNAELTFKQNIHRGRHGWLRLTPAYSVTLVEQILNRLSEVSYVLDPFCGTGTTAVVCAQRGLRCDSTDINPFLIWLATVKNSNYAVSETLSALHAAQEIAQQMTQPGDERAFWTPSIANIGRWWSKDALHFLAKLRHYLFLYLPTGSPHRNLLLIAFCQLLIELSNAAFNHQSTSFKQNETALLPFNTDELHTNRFLQLVWQVTRSAGEFLPGHVHISEGDARTLSNLPDLTYDAVITSPPYANRMSYIRELRPYMYWLGYLQAPREAGDLDWLAIGGTWGIATSRLQTWLPVETALQFPSLDKRLAKVAERSPLLSTYIHRYVVDIADHLRNLHRVVQIGGRIFYVVGNSKFYDTVIPVKAIYAHLMEQSGFEDINIEVLRKRNSKKELFEFLVSAVKHRSIDK